MSAFMSASPPLLPQGQTKETEYFYGAEFSSEPLPATWLRRWQGPQPNKALHLPAANPFISTDFAMQEVRGMHEGHACSFAMHALHVLRV